MCHIQTAVTAQGAVTELCNVLCGCTGAGECCGARTGNRSACKTCTKKNLLFTHASGNRHHYNLVPYTANESMVFRREKQELQLDNAAPVPEELLSWDTQGKSVERHSKH